MPSALLVDTNFSAWPILRALEKKGIEVHVVGAFPNDALARAHSRYHKIDYTDASALSHLVDVLNSDYLVPGCNDRSYMACASLAQERGFVGFDSVQNAEIINNKALFREAATRLGLSQPRIIPWEQEYYDVSVIVKPVDAYSGKGITVLHYPDRSSILIAGDKAKAVSQSDRFIVEEFVEGQLYSHSAFLVNQSIKRDFWVVEHCSVNPFVVDTSHLAIDLPLFVQTAIRAEVERFACSLGLVNGLLHCQFIFKENKYVILEVTRRCPGDLYSQLIQLSTGFDYSAAYVEGFIGETETLTREVELDTRFILRHTITGNVTAPLAYLQFKSPLQIERWVPLATCGEVLRPSPLGRIGILFSKAASQESLLHQAKATVDHVLYHVDHADYEEN